MHTQLHKKNVMLVFITYHWNIMVSTTQTLSQIKSQEFISQINQHFMIISPLTYVTNGIQEFVKCCSKSWVHLDIRPNDILLGRLQSLVAQNTICVTLEVVNEHCSCKYTFASKIQTQNLIQWKEMFN